MPASTKTSLVEHLRTHAVRTDGPFTLRSGERSSWYIDARQTTFDGVGARLVGQAVAAVLPRGTTAVGGLTMGADPIAIATAMSSSSPLKAFSIRKEAKTHGAGGRLVGPVAPGDRVVVVEDTTTTGSAIMEAVEVLIEAGIAIGGVVSLVDRSGGAVAARLARRGLAYEVIVSTDELGVT
ncbi:MAG TPA: orotate phosphoribosyltransferase [Acidimicrobiia bacterium]|jgi:orotate phosphoribosyltransferase|nr:orotate phosphoribosyltransferase [Acidimicrobiia bacterium]